MSIFIYTNKLTNIGALVVPFNTFNRYIYSFWLPPLVLF